MEENNERCIPDRHHHDHNTIAAIAALGVVAYLGQSQCLGDLGVLLSAFSLTDEHLAYQCRNNKMVRFKSRVHDDSKELMLCEKSGGCPGFILVIRQ